MSLSMDTPMTAVALDRQSEFSASSKERGSSRSTFSDAAVDGGDHKIVTGSVDDAWYCESDPQTCHRRVIGTHSSSWVIQERKAMFVLVDNGRVSVRDVDNLKAFHVEVTADISDSELDELLRARDYGFVSGGSAFISVARVRESTTDVEGVAAMVDYAQSKGWVDEDGEALQAHVVRQK